MAIKISQFAPITAVASTTLLAVVDPAGPTSFNATAAQLQTFVLTGNAATATNIAASTTALAATVVNSSLTSVGTLTNLSVTNTISGSVSGNAGTVTNGIYTSSTGVVTNAMLAGSIANNKLSNSSITINGVAIALGGSGSVSADVGIATAVTLGSVIIGNGISVTAGGSISVDTSIIATRTYVDNTSTDNAISFSVALG